MAFGEDDRQDVLDQLGKIRTLLDDPSIVGVFNGHCHVGPIVFGHILRHLDNIEKIMNGERWRGED